MSARSAFMTLALAGLGCSRGLPESASKDLSSPASVAAKDKPAVVSEIDAKEVDSRFVAELKSAFAVYRGWGRVDDELRWAPFLCRIPEPGRPAMSAADDGGHARKLYSLFAKDRAGYVALGSEASKPKAGQIIVKESYVPELVSTDGGFVASEGISGRFATDDDHFDPLFRDGSKTYRASKLAGIYVVISEPDGTAGTDDGWIYGTLTPSGEVTSAGKVASCAGCHASASHGKLFGRKAR